MNSKINVQKTAYVGLSVDFLHNGHIRLINKASSLGVLTVGLLTDAAVSGHKLLPILNFDQRKELLLGIKGVSSVVEQDSWDYSRNILNLKPDFFVHGDDWNTPEYSDGELKDNVLRALKSYNGKLIEVTHTPGLRVAGQEKILWMHQSTPEIRSQQLRRILFANRLSGRNTRIIETHSPISALIAEEACFVGPDGTKRIFDGFWSSSLTDSTLLGKPDTESLDLTTRLSNAEKIIAATARPMIFDGDTGGKIEHFAPTIKSIERVGISAIVIEDKVGLKRNSLLGNSVTQNQSSIEDFTEKIKEGKSAQGTPGFMIFARVESLVLDQTMEHALERADHYVSAGADGIFISSKSGSADEVLEFTERFRKHHSDPYVALVPSTYSQVFEEELYSAGVDLVIYANHLFRSSFPAMKRTALSILKNHRAHEVENDLLSIKEILNLIPGTSG